MRSPELLHVLAVFQRYVEARNALLHALRLERPSNRDPLAEFSERLAATLVRGTLAESPVQKGWDVRCPDGESIQVKYVANSGNSTGSWVNEHTIHVNELMDSYAIVIFEDFQPQAVIIFPAHNLAAVGMKFASGTTIWIRHFSLRGQITAKAAMAWLVSRLWA